MNWLQTSRVAGRALLRNKMRSFLTVLGVIIGVGAVIAMVALGEGAKQRVQDAFASMGSDLLIVLPGSTSRGGSFGGFGSMPTLTWDDVRAMQTELSSVRAAAATLRSNAQVLAEDMNWTTSVTGTSPAYFSIRSWPTAQGSLFSESDVEGANKVIVLGATVSDKLFGPGIDPTGRSVRVKNIPFVVVGVLAKKGQSPTGQDYDDGVFVPQTTFQAKIQGGLQKFVGGSLMVGAQPGQTARAQRQITDLLRDRHHTPPGADDDFSIRNLTELASSQEESTKTFTSLLAAIAAVSLAVGGIGIMNIMLVSVTERTREIGLRMAVGAKPRHVALQFLVEALSLSAAGGLIGVGIGIGVARWLADSLGWPVLIRMDIVVVSVAFSGLVGVVFGLYPALKASRLDPIEALRFE
ncbi:MAG TPA: ABC transporter permease [Myxococcaceae bacterium]|nr:ABC transporter permease [Myxococcaceae bacterium]